MSTSWQDINKEIQSNKGPDKPFGDFDGVRRAKYKLVKSLTKRPLLVYATAFHNPAKSFAFPLMSIDLSDKDGFYEITRDIKASEVDVYLHSPGGSAEATESIVEILRSKFKKVRFIVTGTAKSAATMLALSGDSILIDKAAELGPIDPQVSVRNRYSPAGSIKEQFEIAVKELEENPSHLPAWIPILQEFAPSLLVECQNFINLSKTLVTEWLIKYMFRGESGAKSKAEKVSNYLTDEKNTLSHARRVDAQKLKELGVKVELLEEQDLKLQDAIRQLHLVIMHTLDSTDAIKIFENSEGAVLFRNIQIQVMPPQI